VEYARINQSLSAPSIHSGLLQHTAPELLPFLRIDPGNTFLYHRYLLDPFHSGLLQQTALELLPFPRNDAGNTFLNQSLSAPSISWRFASTGCNSFAKQFEEKFANSK